VLKRLIFVIPSDLEINQLTIIATIICGLKENKSDGYSHDQPGVKLHGQIL